MLPVVKSASQLISYVKQALNVKVMITLVENLLNTYRVICRILNWHMRISTQNYLSNNCSPERNSNIQSDDIVIYELSVLHAFPPRASVVELPPPCRSSVIERSLPCRGSVAERPPLCEKFALCQNILAASSLSNQHYEDKRGGLSDKTLNQTPI